MVDKTVMVIGGTGSLGSALSDYIINNIKVKKLIVFSRGWLKQKELSEKLNDDRLRCFIGDIRDKDRLKMAMNGVDIVIHAAAIKDLASCEFNPAEAMLTNVVGTQNVIDACIERKVSKCLFISTDKAVNPANLYGSTKNLGEKLWIQANKYAATDNILFCVARYGNVFGSAGSVVEKWDKLIKNGAKTLPVSNIDATRFSITMRAAVLFVERCIGYMDDFKQKIYLTKMKSYAIKDLVRAFDAGIEVTGMIPGEKLHEEICEGVSSDNNDNFLSVMDLKKLIRDWRKQNGNM